MIRIDPAWTTKIKDRKITRASENNRLNIESYENCVICFISAAEREWHMQLFVCVCLDEGIHVAVERKKKDGGWVKGDERKLDTVKTTSGKYDTRKGTYDEEGVGLAL